MRTAMIGLGSMGLPMAKHMVNKGFHVYGYDVSSEAMAQAAQFGIEPIDNLEELAQRAEVVLVMVQTDQQVEEIVRNSGFISALQRDSVICIASSISPYACQELELFVAEKGIGLLDTPVVLGQEAANNGTLTVLAGGQEQWVKKAEPVLMAFGSKVFHVGESGAGQVAKTANNLLLWTTMVGNYEVLQLTKRLGVDTGRLIEALMHSSGANWSLSRWGKSTGKWSEKDMDVALE